MALPSVKLTSVDLPRPKALSDIARLVSNQNIIDGKQNDFAQAMHLPAVEKKYKTIGESTEEVSEKNISSLRSFGLATATLLGVSASSLAFLARIFTKEPDRKDSFAKKFEPHAKRCTAVSYSIFAIINTLKALRSRDLGLAFSNFLEIPISMLSAPENLTLNRGLSIGLGNIAMEAQRIMSKEKYKDYGEGINYLTKSLTKILHNFKADPFRTLTDMRHGYGSAIFSALTAISPLIKKITGSNFLAYNFRHWPGIIMEFGKINPINLKRGAFNYWTCGVMMFLSSGINLLGGIIPQIKQSSEILTWIPNVIGRRLLAAANIYRETSRDREVPEELSIGRAFKLAVNEIFHLGNDEFHSKVRHASA